MRVWTHDTLALHFGNRKQQEYLLVNFIWHKTYTHTRLHNGGGQPMGAIQWPLYECQFLGAVIQFPTTETYGGLNSTKM
jgi:hypothetical protein